MATIGGTSRLILSTATGILNAHGDTTRRPITFGPASSPTWRPRRLLTFYNNSPTFDGGAISGAGTC